MVGGRVTGLDAGGGVEGAEGVRGRAQGWCGAESRVLMSWRVQG